MVAQRNLSPRHRKRREGEGEARLGFLPLLSAGTRREEAEAAKTAADGKTQQLKAACLLRFSFRSRPPVGWVDPPPTRREQMQVICAGVAAAEPTETLGIAGVCSLHCCMRSLENGPYTVSEHHKQTGIAGKQSCAANIETRGSYYVSKHQMGPEMPRSREKRASRWPLVIPVIDRATTICMVPQTQS